MDQAGIWIGWIFGIIGVVIGVRGEVSRANPVIHWRFTDGTETFTTRRLLPSVES